MSDLKISEQYKQATGNDCETNNIQLMTCYTSDYIGWLEEQVSQANEASKQPDTKALDLQNVKPCFLPQPSAIEAYCDEKEWRHYDDDGWTGQFTVSAKNILDIMIDLNKA